MRWVRMLTGLAIVVLVVGAGSFAPTRPVLAQTGDCMQFIADLTIPDGLRVELGQELEKVWRVANCGQSTWDGYRAVRVRGDFGPASFEVPRTPPGAELDLRVRLQAPTELGEHQATYRLEGPGGQFGGMFVLVSIADCAPPPAPAQEPGAPLDPTALSLSGSDLGPGWCFVSRERTGDSVLGGTGEVTVYNNSTEYATPRRVQLWLYAAPSVERAEQAMKLPLLGLFAHGIRHLGEGLVELGDDQALRVLWGDESGNFVAADYVLRVDTVAVWVEARGRPGQESDLDAQALWLAQLQVERIRAVEAQAGPPVVPGGPTLPPGPAATARAAARAYTITDLSLPPGVTELSPEAINVAGEVVGILQQPPESTSTVYRPRAVRWDGSGWIELSGLDTVHSVATEINAAGQIVGWAAGERDRGRAVLWEQGRMVELGRPGDGSQANDINATGQVVGMAAIDGVLPSHAVLWEQGAMRDLGVLGRWQNQAIAINDLGQVVGTGMVDAERPTPRAFLWQDGQLQALGTLGGAESGASGINTAGQIVGESQTARFEKHAFLWQDGVMCDLGTLGGPTSRAAGINAAGQVVGESKTDQTVSHAFIWEDGLMVDLNRYLPAGSGWELHSAEAINDGGQIVGVGTLGGAPRVYLLTPSRSAPAQVPRR